MSFLRSRVVALAVAVSLVTTSVPSMAANHPPLGKALTGHAKSDYEAGRLLAQTGDYAGALIKFTSAYQDSKDPRLLWNMAACEKSLHHYAATANLLDRYLSEGAEGWLTVQDHDDADQIQQTIRALYGRVSLHVLPKDAEVALDGKEVTIAPNDDALRVDLGKHALHFSKAGYEPQDRAIEITGDDHLQVQISLDKAAAGGTLAVRAGNGDMISIDGKAAGVGTAELTLPAGVHAVRVTADGKEAREVPVTVHEGERKSIELQAESRSSHTWMFVAGGAVLAVGVGIGAFFLLKPRSTEQGPAQQGSIPPGTVNLP